MPRLDCFFFFAITSQFVSKLRTLFGPEEVEATLRDKCVYLDTWFTGGDFAGAALEQLKSAIKRRTLAATSDFCFRFTLGTT